MTGNDKVQTVYPNLVAVSFLRNLSSKKWLFPFCPILKRPE